MKRWIAIIPALAVLLALTGCGNKPKDLTVGNDPSGFVIAAPKVTTADYQAVADNLRSISIGGACTAHIWKTDAGSKAEVRNLDFFYSRIPAFAYYFDVDGCYRSWNFSLPTADCQTYADIMENGLSKETMDLVASLPYDVFNEKGLYAEVNIRSIEYDLTTFEHRWTSEAGSNPGAEKTRHIAVFGREIGNNCATVAEAIEYARSINWVLNADCPYFLAWYVNDGESSALFELVDDQLCITENAVTNSNYFVAEPYASEALFDMGSARTAYVEDNIPDGTGFDAGVDAMLRMYYSQIYSADSCFDCMSEFEGEVYDCDGDGTVDTLICKDNRDAADVPAHLEAIEGIRERFAARTNGERMDFALNWHTVYSTAVDWSDPNVIRIQFMEDPAMTYDFNVSNGRFKLVK